MKVEQEFHGEAFIAKLNQAAGMAVVAIGVNIAVEAKRITHVQSGTLKRSIHVSPENHEHGDDENIAKGADMLDVGVEPSEGAFGPSIEVGSWLPYACVEWVGRGHPGITDAMESVRGARMDMIVASAYQRAGLGRGGGGGGGASGHFLTGGEGQLGGYIRRRLEEASG